MSIRFYGRLSRRVGMSLSASDLKRYGAVLFLATLAVTALRLAWVLTVGLLRLAVELLRLAGALLRRSVQLVARWVALLAGPRWSWW